MSADFSETSSHTKDGFDTIQPLVAQDEVNISSLPTKPLVDVAARTSSTDPITPDIQLTPRQQRVLHYLARRRARNIAIKSRTQPDGILDSNGAIISTTPAPLTPAPVSDAQVFETIHTEQVTHASIIDSVPTITPVPPGVPVHLPKVRAAPFRIAVPHSP